MINKRAKIILDFCFVKTPLEQWFKKDDEFSFDILSLEVDCNSLIVLS